MNELFKKYPEAGAGKAGRKVALEVVSYNIKWLERYKPAIQEWLNDSTQ